MAAQRTGCWAATVWLGLRISAWQWNLGNGILSDLVQSRDLVQTCWVIATLVLSIRGSIGNVHVYDAIIFAGFMERLGAVSWGGQRPKVATA